MKPVRLELRNNIALISIDNPPVNALSHAVRDGLMRCIEQADADPQMQAIVIICDGRTFIAGADIREFDMPPQAPFLPDIVDRIDACKTPVIAAIHGTALGGGLEVAMGCHYRIALASAKVGLPEVLLGLLPGASGTQRLPRLVGAELALNMMLSGKPVAAQAALDAGLIDLVIGEDDLSGAALEFAADVVDKGPRHVRDLPVAAVAEDLFEKSRANIAKKARGLFSPEKIIRCVELATRVTYEEGCNAERELFMECKDSPQSAGLRHAFFAERTVNKVPGISKETTVTTINKVAVLGAGTMGAGIAYSCLNAGYSVHLLDNNEEGLERGRTTIEKLFEGGIARGKISKEKMQETIEHLTLSANYDDLGDADLVIEAVFENMAIKKEVFAKLDQVCKRGAILASNTSTLDVDEIAAATKRPQDVIGLHFFSPAHIMRLLEIIRGRETSAEVIATSLRLTKTLGKIGVVVGNCFGFVGNRMLYSYGRENQFLLLEGASPEQIDQVLYDWGMAMGPNAVGDLAGLDVGYKARQERSDLPDDPRFYRIANMLAELGRFGQKTGKGMYFYEEGSREPMPDPQVQLMIERESRALGIKRRDIGVDEIVERCIYGLINEGARILGEEFALRASDIDVIWTNGYGFPRHRGGPMHYADSVGLDNIYEKVREFRNKFGAEFWEPAELLTKLAGSGATFADFDRDAN